MKDMEQKERFIELRALGWSFDRIAEELKISKQTLIQWSRDFALEIGNLQAIRLDALRDKYVFAKEKRLEVFGELLNRVKEELTGRDLSTMPSEKLSDLLFKLLATLKEEDVTPEFKGKGNWESQLKDSLGIVTWKA